MFCSVALLCHQRKFEELTIIFGQGHTSSGVLVYAARVHFGTSPSTSDAPALEWPAYVTSGIISWIPSPVKLITRK